MNFMRGILQRVQLAGFTDDESLKLVTAEEMEIENPQNGICMNPSCRAKTAKWHRQNTAYEDDKLNWSCLCNNCQVEADDYWEEMWDEVPRG